MIPTKPASRCSWAVPALALAALLIPAGERTEAAEWPTGQAELRASFGQNDRGRPTVGMMFDGDDAVRAVDAGEVVFSATGSSFSGLEGFPQPLGEWTAVDHGNGMISVYGRLEARERAQVGKTVVEKGAPVGRSGSTGWAESLGFYFSVYDRVERRWVNPVAIAPARDDNRPPTIRSIVLVGRDGPGIALAPNRVVRQGAYRLVGEASDMESGRRQFNLAPQRRLCLINGTEQGSLHLETIRTENGQLMTTRTRPAPAAQVYLDGGAFDLGEVRLNRGRTTMELIVRDANGNERVSNIVFQVE